MGLIKAITGAIGGSLADQWLEVYEPGDMSDNTIFVPGVKVHQNSGRTSNTKGTDNTISNGSVIHVYDDQMMMLVDGGKVVDYTAEPGYYKVDNSALPSMFNGQFKDTLKESFSRIKYGGNTPTLQKVFYINLQEIKGIKFGTPNPVNYYDNFYDCELYLRAFGTYSIKVQDPFKFYREVIPKSAVTSNHPVNITDVNAQYLSEFLSALQSAINQMSADGERISFVSSKSRELSKYMADILDEEWNQMRGFIVQAVGVDSISYDESSQAIINTRNEAAILQDSKIQQGYMARKVGEGIAAAGANEGGAMNAFLGMGMAMNNGANIMAGYQQQNANNNPPQPPAPQQQQPSPQPQPPAPEQTPAPSPDSWVCTCGTNNTGKFCAECGLPKPAPSPDGEWTCNCGKKNKGKFCSECGQPKPTTLKCSNCGYEPEKGSSPKFCPECGTQF